MKAKSLLHVTLVALAAAVPAAAHAQSYPSKPVRLLIPWPPGGSNDIVGRIVFAKMSEQMGQQFVIENRGGAAGTIGSDLVAKAAPDGYTVMVHSATHIANAHLYKNLPYDTLGDFIGVTPLARQVGMLVVHPSMPVRTLKEFIALAKKRPGEITYASSGNGSYVHLSMALMASMAGIKMIHVPYKGGGPAGVSIAAGETQAMLATIGSLVPHIRAKRVRPLGVASEDRVKQYPDVPTIAEAGVPDYEFTAWVGVFVPAKTPGAIVDRLNAELKKALAVPNVVQTLEKSSLDPMHMTPDQFAKRLRSDYEKYERVIRESGAKID